jgi:hypothetical protein
LRLFFAEVLIHRATHTEHSVSRLQLTGKPADRVGLYRIHREADHFGTLASRALEGALIESAGAGRDARQRHPVLAHRAHRTLVGRDSHP